MAILAQAPFLEITILFIASSGQARYLIEDYMKKIKYW